MTKYIFSTSAQKSRVEALTNLFSITEFVLVNKVQSLSLRSLQFSRVADRDTGSEWPNVNSVRTGLSTESGHQTEL